MKKKNGLYKLHLKKSIVHSLERAAAGHVLGGDGNTSKLPPITTRIPDPPVPPTGDPEPKPLPKPVEAAMFLEAGEPVCTGR